MINEHKSTNNREAKIQRENSFDKQLNYHMGSTCEEENKDLCKSRNCICACSQIAEMMRKCREKHLDGQGYYLLTIFDNKSRIGVGSLSKYDIKKANETLLRKLNRLKIPGLIGFGGFDIQLQDFIDDNGKRSSKWLPHWHLYIAADVSEKELKALIYPKFNAGKTTRIAFLKIGNDEPFGCTYLYKPLHKFKKKLSSSEFGQRKRTYRIRGKNRKELHCFLENNDRTDWIVLIGFRRYGNKIVKIRSGDYVINKDY